MNLTELDGATAALARAKRRNRWTLMLLALVLAGLYLFGSLGLSRDERAVMIRVAAAHRALWDWRSAGGLGLDGRVDPWRTGMIGMEWSPLSTTLGSLPAKRTACDARWAVILERWLDALGVEPGDRVVMLSSSSFPGLLLSATLALEARKADVITVLSLGASTWGANVPGATWLDMAGQLRAHGLLHRGVDFCTPGGDDETGGGLSSEALSMMEKNAARWGVPFVRKSSLAETVAWKMALIDEYRPKVVISIGGSEANLGDDPTVLDLAPGLHRVETPNGGTGVIGLCLVKGVPVIHLLEIRQLCAATGIPFDGAPSALIRSDRSLASALVGLTLFGLVMVRFRRWDFWKDDEM